MDPKLVLNNLEIMFKDARCELNYSNDWQLLIAVLLSAQSSDKMVNQITPILFAKYPSLKDLKEARIDDVKEIIKPIGLSNNKARNIIGVATILCDKYNEEVPSIKEELVELPGIGNKTANVMLIECFGIPAFPVDTHISRVSKRLKLCDEKDSVLVIERKLRNLFEEKEWGKLHMRMVLFGRYICKALHPECERCLFKERCTYNKK